MPEFETSGFDGSAFRFDDPEVAPERKTTELHEQPADDVLCEDGAWRPQTSPDEQAKGHFRGMGGIVYEGWDDPGHYDF